MNIFERSDKKIRHDTMNIFDQLDELDKIEEERLRKSKYFTDDGVEINIRHVETTTTFVVESRLMTWEEYLRNPF